MLTPYERHLTRLALEVQIKPRGPMAQRMAEDAERESRLRQIQRREAMASLRDCDHREPDVEMAILDREER